MICAKDVFAASLSDLRPPFMFNSMLFRCPLLCLGTSQGVDPAAMYLYMTFCQVDRVYTTRHLPVDSAVGRWTGSNKKATLQHVSAAALGISFSSMSGQLRWPWNAVRHVRGHLPWKIEPRHTVSDGKGMLHARD